MALSDDEVAGAIAPCDIGNNQGALCKMFVKATHRGKSLAAANP